jgi:hypothetical protein
VILACGPSSWPFNGKLVGRTCVFLYLVRLGSGVTTHGASSPAPCAVVVLKFVARTVVTGAGRRWLWTMFVVYASSWSVDIIPLKRDVCCLCNIEDGNAVHVVLVKSVITWYCPGCRLFFKRFSGVIFAALV